MKPLRIRTWIILLILISSVIPTLVLCLFVIRQHYLDKLAEAREKHLLVAKGLANTVDAFVTAHKMAIETMAGVLSAAQPAPKESQEFISRLKHTYPVFLSITLTDRTGKSIAFVPPVASSGGSNIGVSFHETDWFVKSSSTKSAYISDPIMSPGEGVACVPMAAPVLSSGGDVSGVLSGCVTLGEVRKLLQGYALGRTGAPVMADRRGRVLVHPREGWEKELKDLSDMPAIEKILREDQGTLTAVSGAGVPSLTGYATVESTGWKVGMPQALSEVRQQAVQSVLRSLVWIPGIIIVLISAAIFLARKIASPLVALAEASAAFGRREPFPVTPAGGLPSLEVHRLYASFQQMVGDIREQTEQMSSLIRVIQIINSGLNLRDLFENCAKEIGRVVPYQRMSCHIVEPSGRATRVYATHRLSGSVHPPPNTPGHIKKGGATDWVLSHGKPVCIEDAITDSRFPGTQKHLLDMGVRSCCIFPLKRDRVIGTLSLEHEQPTVYSPMFFAYLESLAHAFSNALANAQLYDQQVAATKRLDASNRIAKLLASDLNIDKVYEAFAAEVFTLVPVDAVQIVFFDAASGMIEAHAVLEKEAGGGLKKGTRTELSKTHGMKVAIETKRPFLRRDNQTDADQSLVLFNAGFRSSIILPLVVRGVAVGALALVHREPDQYTASQLDVLNPVAEQLAVATDNSRLFKQTELLLQQQRLLAEVTSEISVLDLEELLDRLVNRVMALFDASTCVVRLVDTQGRNELRAVAARNDDLKAFITSTRKHGLTSGIIQTRQPTVTTDFHSDPRFSDPSEAFRLGLTRYMGVPILLEGAIGVLSVSGSDRMDVSGEQLNFLERVAAATAMAIHNARLYGKLKEKEAENLRLLKQQRLLSEVTSEISLLDLDELLEKLTERVRALFDVDVCFLRLVSPSGQLELKAVAATNQELKEFISARPTTAEGASMWVVTNQQPLVFGEERGDMKFRSAPEAQRLGLRSYTAVPIISKGQKSLGMLGVFSSGAVGLSSEQVIFLEQVAREAAVAIHNAQLYHELEAANQWKEEVVANVSHELRTPLGVIIGNAELLLEEIFGVMSERQKQAIGKIRFYASHLTSLVNGLLSFAHIEKTGFTPVFSMFPLEEIVESIQSLGKHHSENSKTVGFSCHVDTEPVSIKSDKSMLVAVLENLIENAFKFTEAGMVEVWVRNIAGERKMEFSVSDTGIGIAGKDLPLIFDQFRQVDGSPTRRHGGFGLGLNLVKKYLDLLKGEIRVASSPGEGSIFTVRIPHEI